MSDNAAQPDLALADTQALVDELRARFPAVLIATCRPHEDNASDQERAYYFTGNRMLVAGLAQWAMHGILANDYAKENQE